MGKFVDEGNNFENPFSHKTSNLKGRQMREKIEGLLKAHAK